MDNPNLDDVLDRTRRFERKGDEPLPSDVQNDAFTLLMEARRNGDTETVRQLLAAAQ